METTLFNMRSSLNPKEGLALLVKTPAESTTQEVQSDGNSLFADMLGQKISEVTLSGSTPDPSTAAQGGKHPLPAVLKGMISSGKGKSAPDGKAKPVADHDTRLSTCNNEPLSGIAGEIDLLAGPTKEKSPSLTEKAEPAEDAKTEIHVAKEMMEHAIAMPVTGESIPHADPYPPEVPAHQITLPHSPAAALFAQTVRPQEAKCLERDVEASSAEKTLLKESPVSAPNGPLPLSDLHTDLLSVAEGDEHGTETAFMQRAAETPQRKNGGSAMDAAFDLHQPIPSPSEHGKRAGELKERTSITATTQKPLSGEAVPDLRQSAPSPHDRGKKAGRSSEGESIIAAPQKPFSAVRDEDSAPERLKPAGSPDKTLSAGDVVVETLGQARDHQQSRNTTTGHAVRQPESDIFPFRMEMPNAASLQATTPPAATGPAGIEMQAVIDQLLAARQVVSNDSGRIRILLNPPNLGTVDLDIVVRGERVEVVMTAENANVQQALQSRGDDIRIALQRQDLKIEGFQVLLQDNGTGQQQTQGGAMYRQDREHREGFNASEDATPVLPVLSPIAGATSAAGRVSIFA